MSSNLKHVEADVVLKNLTLMLCYLMLLVLETSFSSNCKYVDADAVFKNLTLMSCYLMLETPISGN